MNKNTAGQAVTLYAVDVSTGLPKTGDENSMVFYVSQDDGTVTAITANSGVPTECDAAFAPGDYRIALSQAETDADKLRFSGVSNTANVAIMPQTIYTVPPNFSALSIDSNGRVRVQSGVTANASIGNFEFLMVLSSDHVTPATGLTVTATRSIDGGAFAACANAVSEVGSGVYSIDLANTDLNGVTVMLKFSAPNADNRFFELITTP